MLTTVVVSFTPERRQLWELLIRKGGPPAILACVGVVDAVQVGAIVACGTAAAGRYAYCKFTTPKGCS